VSRAVQRVEIESRTTSGSRRDTAARLTTATVVVAAVGLLGTTLALLVCALYRPPWAPDSVTALSLLTCAFGGTLIVSRPGGRMLGFVGVYGLYLALAHLGAVGAILAGPDSLQGLPPWQTAWLQTPQRTMAVALSGLACASLVWGALAVRGSRQAPSRARQTIDASWPGIYWVGVSLLLVAAGFMLVAGASITAVTGSYADFRRSTADSPHYSMMLFCLATGLAFTVATGSRTQVALALCLFAIPGGLLAVTGNRGEILYPAAAAVAAYATRGVRIRARWAAAGLVTFFVFIPVVEQVRQAGLGHADLGSVSLRWSDPFRTIGWTLRPLTFTVGWIDGGETFAAGQTYVLPLKRLVGTLTPFVERPTYESHSRYLKGRLPGQGYSVVAEAYYNFGVPGVLLVPFGLGVFLGVLGDRARTGLTLAFAAAVLAVLVNNVRNFSLFVPGQVFGVTVLWLAGIALTIAMRYALALPLALRRARVTSHHVLPPAPRQRA
jgi:hypothetical protein